MGLFADVTDERGGCRVAFSAAHAVRWEGVPREDWLNGHCQSL